MYPIDCFNADNQDKLEAVKYYIDLNKSLLKEIDIDEYQAFADYVKGEGKDILMQISQAKTDTELKKLLTKIEAKLPYATKLKKVTNFEQKVQMLHKEFAKLYVRGQVDYDRKSALKKQRELAGVYDEVVELCNEYKDAVNHYNYVKSSMSDKETLAKLYASKATKQSPKEFTLSLRESIDGMKQGVKEKRAKAFTAIREYYINEFIYMLENDMSMAK